MFSKLSLSWLDEVSQLQTFDGYCRYGESSDAVLIEIHDADTLQNCYNQCKTKDGCCAFVLLAGHYCFLYSGGPYTKGTGDDVKCYTMPTCDGTYSYSCF